MKNWKTSLAGICAACGAALVTNPEYHGVGMALLTVGTGLTGILAKDHDAAPAPVQGTLKGIALFALLGLVVGIGSGCTIVHGTTFASSGTNQPPTITRFFAGTLFDGNSTVAKGGAMVSTNKSASGVTGLQEASTGSNAVTALQILGAIAASGAK